ncbi:MAG: hypothetical protein HFH82_16545 [Lachnospiraceae bacterium]|nr:hypothetical protein [Lachnospiraceae bacterium]
MSFDLAVFEKNEVTTNQSEFLKWFHQKAECENVSEISCASDKLQKFFHSIRDIFPPMNGEFSPDDKFLSENPEIEKYLCDYTIREDMIYLSFSYSVSEFAYDTIRRAAYFAEVGFFNPSSHSLPIFFDSRYPMILEGEGFQAMEIVRFESIREKLNNMTVKNRSYLYVTDPIGNYVQIGGYGDAFIVEKRIYTSPTDYVHVRAGYSGAENVDKAGEVMIAGNCVKVKPNQVLSKRMAEQLFLDFFRNEETMDSVEWMKMDV